MIDPKTALAEVVHVLDDIKQDPTHAADHGADLAEAVAHLREANVDVPGTLSALTDTLCQSARAKAARDEDIEDLFDNMPI